MRRLLAILGLVLTSCAAGSNPDPTGPAPAQAPVFQIVEVGFAPDYVTVENFSDTEASLAGRWLCDPPACFELPALDVEGGSSARIALGTDEGVDGAVISDTGLDSLAPEDGELGLYGSSDTEDPGAIEDYVEWGATPHDGTAIAVEAGLWREDSYAPSGETGIRIYVDPETGLWLWDSSDG